MVTSTDNDICGYTSTDNDVCGYLAGLRAGDSGYN